MPWTGGEPVSSSMIGGVRGRPIATTLLATLAAVLAGCAGTTGTASRVTGSSLRIYASQAGGGAQSQDVLDAERLALQQASGQVGRFKVELMPLAGAKVSDDARRAVADRSTIAYLGELGPHRSADSLGITNGVGLLQVSPIDSAIELTQTTPAVKGAPTNYYESLKTYGRTFGRVVPPATHEARALIGGLMRMHVRRLYVTADASAYGKALALAVSTAAGASIVITQGQPQPAAIAAAKPDALFYATTEAAGAERLFGQLASTSPQLKLFGSSGLGSDAFARSLTAAAQRSTSVIAPGFLSSALPPGATKFLADFKAAYHRPPAQAAIFGYEAMSVVLDALRRAGANAGNRTDVVKAFFATKARPSALGPYSITGDGDTTLAPAPYVLSQVKAGKLVAFEAVQG